MKPPRKEDYSKLESLHEITRLRKFTFLLNSIKLQVLDLIQILGKQNFKLLKQYGLLLYLMFY